MTPLEKHDQLIAQVKAERDATPYGPHWKDLNRKLKKLQRQRGMYVYFQNSPQPRK